MSFNPNRLTFKIDEITGEIIQPQIFLCDRQLNKIGEIYPVGDLRIKSVLNGADEISFSTPKDISDKGNVFYHKIKDYSVVFVQGFGYFEVSPTINDTYTSIKTLNGHSLGESELSQLFCTLECNTNSDMENFAKLHPTKPYISTVLYSNSMENRKYSLIHRILAYAPNYNVGTVDDTIKNIQRTFSFSNKDILSCFSEVAQEIGCIFDIVVRKNQDGVVERVINIYDAQYCSNCRSRNVINGVCQDCGDTNIGGIGEDTNIAIGTDNLSDEITLTPDGNMKNCFILEGGDDIITSTVEGILPSGNKKLYMFSPETKQLFSPELQKKYDEYVRKFNNSREPYEKLLEIQYGVLDLILYLQSARMPTTETSVRNLHEEVKHIIDEYNSHFPNGLGLTKNSDTISRNSIVRQVLSLFVDNGYAVRQEKGNYDAAKLRWTGDLVVYDLRDNSSQAIIHVSDNASTIDYSDTTENETSAFYIKFSENYSTYLKQMVAITTKNYELIEEQGLNQPKEWQKYSLNRLYSFESGYQSCIEALEEEKNKSNLPGVKSAAKDIQEKYHKRKKEISEYLVRLEDIIFHLYSYYGNADYIASSISSESKIFTTAESAFQHMVHYIRYGTWAGGSENEITDYPIYCKNCGSKNVTLTGCKQCQKTNITTYSELAQMVCEHYALNHTNLETQRKNIRENNSLQNSLGEILYGELCSFIREDLYNNNNFISDGLSNSELIQKSKELIKKAEQELAKACISQHTLSGNIYSFAAYSRLSKEDFPIKGVYDGFKLGNFMRYFADDGKTYKLRLSSEEFSWTDSGAELNVEFTDVIEYLNGGIHDLASLMQTMGNLSTSFDSVKKQAEQGAEANLTFQRIQDEGLQSALSNVLNARNIDAQIDEHGITLRKYDYELDDYDQHQMKLINRNIVMTDDGWQHARLAIGLGTYNENLMYGVWADLLVGDLIIGEKLVIKNQDQQGNSSVTIDKNGITIKNGTISWEKVNAPQISNIAGLSKELSSIRATADTAMESIEGKVAQLDQKVAQYLTNGGSTSIDENYMISPYIGGGYLNITSGDKQVVIDPSKSGGEYIFQVKSQGETMVGIKANGEALFAGEIMSTKGNIGGWNISNKNIYISGSNEKNKYHLDINSENCSITSRKIITENILHESGTIIKCNYYETISIESGALKLSYKSAWEDNEEPIYEDYLLLTESGLIIKSNDKTCCSINKYGIREKDKYLADLYGVVKTGVNALTGGDNYWELQRADFGVTYRSEPLINVMFYGSIPDSGVIVFKDYIRDSKGGYTGFTFLVYTKTKTPGENHSAKWWAVGNVKA
ncbi:MAG: hypothetical protein HFJ06_08545 [Lachnospiraceae bacterium]|nr:hypothetical protein [Lachnospiraceae bacterium]